jgi:methylglutaconyl-CoA hydratase
VIEAIGTRYARRYFPTAERFDAGGGLRIGLVHDIVQPRSSMAGSTNCSARLLLAGRRRRRECKTLIRTSRTARSTRR